MKEEVEIERGRGRDRKWKRLRHGELRSKNRRGRRR